MPKKIVVDMIRMNNENPFAGGEDIRRLMSKRLARGWTFVTVVSSQGEFIASHHFVFSREGPEEESLLGGG